MVLGSRGASVDFKGFFGSRVRKWLKMDNFTLWTFEPALLLGNKRKSRLFRRLVFSGRNGCAIYEPILIKRIEVSFSIVIIFMFYPLHKFNHGTSNRC